MTTLKEIGDRGATGVRRGSRGGESARNHRAIGLGSRRSAFSLLGGLRVVSLAPLLMAGVAAADKVLDRHDASLTNYVPTSRTATQGVRPNVVHRAIQIDGSPNWPTMPASGGPGGGGIAPPGSGLELGWLPGAPNVIDGGIPGGGCDGDLPDQIDVMTPPQGASAPPPKLGEIDLATGSPRFEEIDLALPAPGFRWRIARSYSAAQRDSGGQFDSNGFQGRNWFQSSAPELAFQAGSTDADDMIYVVWGAAAYTEFVRNDSGVSVFKSKNGANAAIEYASGSPDTWTLTAPDGTRTTFFGGNTSGDAADWQLWKIEDVAGNLAYVGHPTNAATAVTSGYSGGRIAVAYDSADRRYTYSYASLDSIQRLSGVTVETKSGGTWASPTGVVEVARVDYVHYVSTDSDIAHGSPGDLKLAKVTLPLSDSGSQRVTRRYYRYWKGSWNGDTNPGVPHLLRHVVDAEGSRRYSLSDATLFAATDEQIKPYASASFEWDSARRVRKTWGHGACGCGGGGSGAVEIAYGDNGSYSDTSGYTVAWKSRAVASKPDGTWLTQYVDEVGQALSRVVTPSDPTTGTGTQWTSFVSRQHGTDASLDGLVHELADARNVTAYNHSAGTFTRSSSLGRVVKIARESSGDRAGLVLSRTSSATGTSGSQRLDASRIFRSTDPSITVGTGSGSQIITLLRPLAESSRVYTQPITSGTSGSIETSVSYAFWSGAATTPKSVTVTLPAVSTGNNGQGSAHTIVYHLRKDGTVAFVKAPDDIYTYTKYADGRLVKRIDDCVLNHPDDFAAGDDPATDFGISENGNGLRRITEYSFDAQGRPDTVTMNAHSTSGAVRIVRKSYYTKLADGKDLTLSYADFVPGGTPTYFGPISFSLTNHAGGAEAQGSIAISQSGITTALASHVDETQSDLLAAIDIGTVSRLSTAVFDESGRHRAESRGYFSIPGSLPGTEGTHYDATRYAYDDAKRLVRTRTADGTITRTDFDGAARPHRTRVGTNDEGEPHGDTTGTNDMTLVSETIYDSVGRVTGRRAFHGTGTGDHRTTSYVYDADGRVVVTVTPTAPYSVSKYDHMGRTIARGLYSTSSGLSETTDPTTTSANRIALDETEYDERGRAFRTTRWKIVQSTGAKDGSLVASQWFDAAGRPVKTDGEQLTKTRYDRLGRTTHGFTLAIDDDSVYAHALDVSGDIVFEEHQTVYDPDDGNVILTASIARRHDDYGGGQTTGALDTNADGLSATLTASDVKGRASITAMWYDDLDRLTTTAYYGTNDGSTFTRPGTVPSSGSTVLVSSTVYDDDGSILETIDPRGRKSRTLRDAMGRTTATIANYVDGTPSSPTGDDDNYIRQDYQNGLRTAYWVDFDGDGVKDSGVDQVTTYTYGVTKGGSAGDSMIATGRLLQKVTYPDGSGSDVVTYAYDTSGSPIWRRDQMGTIVETSYDAGGRREHERVTAFGTGIDQTAKRITYGYDSHGRLKTTTTYDDATPGSGLVLNQVESAWDDWGNLATFKVDPDSVVGGTGVPTKEISYSYATATAGRNTIRRTGVTLPGSATASFVYGSGSANAYADEASRLQRVEISSVSVVEYDYLGTASVIGVEYPQPAVFQRKYGSTSGTWPDLDRFGRVVNSRWTKDLSTDMDFVSMQLTYDENSNPLTADEGIYATGFDVKYSIDGLDRLTDAEEGTLSGSTIATQTRRQQWTLSRTGNWDAETRDMNGAGAGYGANGLTETRTHNIVNELTGRSVTTDGGGPTSKTLSYDAAGNLIDDGQDYEYVYDAWHRLVRIEERSSGDIVSEHRYYGNGFRAGERYDSNEDGRVNSSDKWYWFGYDERWRIVGTFRDADSSPKERFLHHVAGMGGYGSSSYIDDLVLRDRDANTDWNDDASDGTLEERIYYCQNWRHDVVALVTSGGALRERVRYTAYGIPVGMPQGDCDGDGDVDAADQSILLGAWGTNTAKCDLNLDGTVDATDNAILLGQLGATAGFGRLSLSGNRFGYAGYASDPAVHADWHVRHRVLMAALGRWSSRDPAGTRDGPSTYGYARGGPLTGLDPTGLVTRLTFFNANPQQKGDCGSLWCNAGLRAVSQAGAANVDIVATIKITIDATCCEPTPSTGTSQRFLERWNKDPVSIPPGTSRPVDYPKPHNFNWRGIQDGNPIVITAAVTQVQLVPAGTIAWNPAGRYVVGDACDAPPLELTRNEWSTATLPPSAYQTILTNEQRAASAGRCGRCCPGASSGTGNQCATTTFASCSPGPAPVCVPGL